MNFKRSKKTMAIMLAMVMLFSLLLPVGSAFAASENRVNKVTTIANDNTVQDIGTLTIKEYEDYHDFGDGEVVRLTLPSGVEWGDIGTAPGEVDVTGATNPTLITKRVLQFELQASTAPAQGQVDIDMAIKASRTFSGDIYVTIDGRNTGVTSGETLIARAIGGDTVTSALDVEIIGENDVGGQILIEESARGALGIGPKVIKLKLPSNFKWDISKTTVTFAGGYDATSTSDLTGYTSGRTLEIPVNLIASSNTQPGMIYITPGISAERNAKYGEVTVNVYGDVDDADVVVANYADYGMTIEVDKVEEVFAGRFDVTTEKITIEEKVPGSLIENRKLVLELPSWVKVAAVQDFDGSDFGMTQSDVLVDDNEVEFLIQSGTYNTTGEGSIEFKLNLSVEANKADDIEMKLNGRAGGEGSLVIAKAVAPVKADAPNKADLRIGVKNQPLNDIVITEIEPEGIMETRDRLNASHDAVVTEQANLIVELSDNIEWSSTPKVEVIEGNLEIDEDAVDTDDNQLIIPIKYESSKASAIKISGIKVDIDRTVPEGKIEATIKGTAVVQNNKASYGWAGDDFVANAAGEYIGSTDRLDAAEFDTGSVVKITVGEVITPAPEAGTVVFNVGSPIYTVGNVTKIMDAAPYIKNDRTYVPVRYLAYALGVSEDDIAYEGGVVTLVKGDDTVQMTIGSTTLVVNGSTVQMDVAPEITSERTMLPARWVAEAFGAQVGYHSGQVVIAQ